MKRKKTKEWKARMNAILDGPFGTVIYIVVGFIVAYALHAGLSLALDTTTPVVAVFSESMKHGPDKYGNICGTSTNTNLKFDDYWDKCGEWYEGKGITKEEFGSWDMKNGFDKGDMIFLKGTDDIKIGDVIVFNTNENVAYGHPIIHRVVAVEGNTFRTKGDNNAGADSWIVAKSQVHGKAVFGVPLLGWFKVGTYNILGLS